MVLFVLVGCLLWYMWYFHTGEQDSHPYAGSILLQDVAKKRFIIVNPNNSNEKVYIDYSCIISTPSAYIQSPCLVGQSIYFLYTIEDIEKRPKLMKLTQDGVEEISVSWDADIGTIYPVSLYVYEDKFLVLLGAPYGEDNKIVSIPKNGGMADVICKDVRAYNKGHIEQIDSSPIPYKDGLICVNQAGSKIKFVNNEYEEDMFDLPYKGLNWLKGWYDQDESLLFWSESPNYSQVVALDGTPLNTLHSYWMWGGLNTSCWDLFGTKDNALLIELVSTKDYFVFTGFGILNFHEIGIYDKTTERIMKIGDGRGIQHIEWSDTPYDPVLFERLSHAIDHRCFSDQLIK
ncbi:hypothetical protein TAMA11512_05330 [Selenomonas sp. TAMA-11512]|nr:hypothetical protein TAMA11512_05330 [Selenomonas sp. TAMA-11512]